MNKLSTLIGIGLSSALVLISIVLGNLEAIQAGDMNGIMQYVDIPSILIVVGGTIGATLTAFNFSKLKNLIKILKIAFLGAESDKVEELYQIIHLSSLARKGGGILAIQDEIEKLTDPYLVKALNLVSDNADPDVIRNIMTAESDSMAQRHQDGQDIISFMADMGPAFGMIGTLVGLVAMLGSLEDPSTIGPKMAVALLTTLYGAMLANMLFIPLGQKMAKRTEEELLIKEALLEGVLAFQAGETSIMIEEKLKSYLNITLKTALEERKQKGA